MQTKSAVSRQDLCLHRWVLSVGTYLYDYFVFLKKNESAQTPSDFKQVLILLEVKSF